MFKVFEGTLAPVYEIALVSVPTDQEKNARNIAEAERLKRELGQRYIAHPFNSIPRKIKEAA
jgi:hypothetical protein